MGFRKGSDLAEELNDFIAGAYEDGTIQELAEKYGVQDMMVEKEKEENKHKDGVISWNFQNNFQSLYRR